MSKIGLHDPFKHLKHKLWPKERLGVKLAIWFSTTKSRELTQFPYVQCATYHWKGFYKVETFISLHIHIWVYQGAWKHVNYVNIVFHY
jgi:hypothetical protein